VDTLLFLSKKDMNNKLIISVLTALMIQSVVLSQETTQKNNFVGGTASYNYEKYKFSSSKGYSARLIIQPVFGHNLNKNFAVGGGFYLGMAGGTGYMNIEFVRREIGIHGMTRYHYFLGEKTAIGASACLLVTKAGYLGREDIVFFDDFFSMKYNGRLTGTLDVKPEISYALTNSFTIVANSNFLKLVLWSYKDEALNEKLNSQEFQIDINPTQWSFGILYYF
jgi:opacity protein-like surface antigen